MKKLNSTRALILGAAFIAPIMLAAPAAAQTYIGVSGGLSIKNDSNNKGTFTGPVPATTVAPIYPAIPTDTTLAWKTEFDKGVNINALIGHRFDGGVRIEGQFSYTTNGVKRHSGLEVGGANIDAVDASVLTRGPSLGATVGTVLNSGIGKTKSMGLYANGYYDFAAGSSFQPYIGAGVGLSRNKVDFRPSNVDVGQGKATKFSYQLMAGATFKVSDGFEVFGQYTYRDAGKTKFGLDLLPADLSVTGKQSIFSLGVRIPLGGGGSGG
jgi:opacity protein-like surface antigen